MTTETLTIARLGSGGDGIADTPAGPVYVPFSLPGEVVAVARVKNHGTIMSIAGTSPERVTPPCAHFGPDGRNGTCGGCTLQHAGDTLYHAFKRDLVVNALKSKGLTPEVAALVIARPGERRRVVFTVRRTEKGMLLGFNQAGSHHIVSIDHCPISSPGIILRLDALRRVADAVATSAEPFRLTVLETLTGLDLAFEGVKKIGNRERQAVTECVLSLGGIARVSNDGEILIEPDRPEIDFNGVRVSPPAGGFTQATKPAEETMAELVLAALGKAKRVADLFSGSGTFALRIARRAKVHAVEGEEKSLAALDRAARHTQGLKPVTVERRDLFRRPLMASELKPYDAVVFDPPRAGAEDQCREIARSGVKTVVAVSCNPLSLARDLAILTAAGYRIRQVTPIDQFLWSAHVEAVAVLEK
ncbi:class I SAM-dependent RNA methyltransferase [Shinella daejeonensis]|uniref:class I SAM-dependent RNA methyltransferase n=1 Tax=Shinella daejeonensis TaxID=659017 RepID=UPI0020C767CC|nr:class I SAM-dependent RNA methyltransferase [Shinella daejeonensis]MCP8897168.1 class I SAM-dependent RNA methyltransferase [Shinella daejeonensis]